MVLLGFPFTSFLGFSTVGLACTHSETQIPRLWETIAPCSFSLCLALRQSLLSAKPALCVPLFGWLLLLFLLVVISMEEALVLPHAPPPHAHSIRLAVLIMVRFVSEKKFCLAIFCLFLLFPPIH